MCRGSPRAARVAARDGAKSPGFPPRLGGRLRAPGSPQPQNQASAGRPGRRRGAAPRRLVPVPPGVFFCTTSATAKSLSCSPTRANPSDDGFKLPHGSNRLPIQGHQRGIGQTPGDGLLAVLAGEERIRAALDPRSVLVFNHEELLGERPAPQFLQAGKLLEKLLTLRLEVGVIGEDSSHIVVLILQYDDQKSTPKAKTHFYLVHPLWNVCLTIGFFPR